jgi:hypothetical protein
MDGVNLIDEGHRKELLKFLLVKTAAVRRGVKPAELLRVRHCYSGVNKDGLRVCLYRSDIYVILGLDYIELKVEEGSSLVLFYNPETLRRTLADKCNSRWLARLGYLPEWTTGEMLEELKRRAATCLIPHEVGVFIGYPLKDVVGFISRIPSTPLHHATHWRVYGRAEESLRRMSIYEREESDANEALLRAKGVSDFIDMITSRKAS